MLRPPIMPRHKPATRVFTDRQEPRDAFWAQYDAYAAAMDGPVRIVNYHGVGGIGKTALRNQLIAEMADRAPGSRYAVLDLACDAAERTLSCQRMLNRIKSDLEARCGFKFPLYEWACYVYRRKCGDNAARPEVSGLLTRHSGLNIVAGILSELPAVGMLFKAMRHADSIGAAIASFLRSRQQELAEMETMELLPLAQSMPKYFTLDLYEALKDEKRPFVFFIDNFEWLAEAPKGLGDASDGAGWIREELMKLPNTLWVILGRQRLDWGRFNPLWEQSITSHRLGSLSVGDCRHFLNSAGVKSLALQDAIILSSGGTPVYLDLCVTIYEQLLHTGRVPTPADFDAARREELVERFMRYLDTPTRELAAALAFLRRWNDDMARLVPPRAGMAFSYLNYEHLISLSFVETDAHGFRHCHNTVGAVMAAQCTDIMKDSLSREAMAWYKDKLRGMTPGDADYAIYLAAFAGFALRQIQDEAQALAFVKERLSDAAAQYAERAAFEQAECVLQPLRDALPRWPSGGLLAAEAMGMEGRLLYLTGRYQEAADAHERAWAIYKRVLGAEHPDTVTAMSALASAYTELGRYQDALTLQEQALAQSQRVLGAEHPDTLAVMNSLALVYGRLGLHQEALNMQERALALCGSVLGAEHPDTLLTLNNLASTHIALGQLPDALHIQEQVLSQSQRVFGWEHPHTMTAMSNLAMIYRGLERMQEALDLHEKALALRKRVLGAEHPDTLDSMNNLAYTYKDLERYAEALDMQSQALEMRRRVLGAEHPTTLTAMNNLAFTYFLIGRQAEATALFGQVHQLRKKVLGSEHPDTLDSEAIMDIISPPPAE